MNVTVTKRTIAGEIDAIPSKSHAHRLLICAALGDAPVFIECSATSRDIEATACCLRALGASIERREDGYFVEPIDRDVKRTSTLDCGESGSTLRFLIPVALAVTGGGVFTGQGRLMERPQKPYFDLFDEKGILWRQEDGVLTIHGRLTPGTYRLPGNVSSQFFTGLLFALALLDGPSEIISTTPLESTDYIHMTLEAMAKAGIAVSVSENDREFRVTPSRYTAFDRTVESDWSQAAFWYAANFLDNQLQLQGMDPDSAQGDKVISELYWKLARPGDTEIDLSGCPDLLPPLAVMAAVRGGITRFVNAARLRIKESDRLSTVAAMLTALGCGVEELPDGLTLHGGASLTGGTVDGANDHRIVMAAAIAASACSGPVAILGAEAVSKSYPDFWEEYQRAGGDFHVL